MMPKMVTSFIRTMMRTKPVKMLIVLLPIGIGNVGIILLKISSANGLICEGTSTDLPSFKKVFVMEISKNSLLKVKYLHLIGFINHFE